jgi:ATP-dependent helicase/nuclease subunit B
LPSIRAKKYLEVALAKHYDKPIFSPNMVTIDQWIRSCSSYQVLDKLDVMFQLYQVHLEIIDPTEDSSFDAFYAWAQMLLSDFEEMEKYLVSPKDLFKNLRDIREIEKWSPEAEELKPAQEKYLQFWDRLKNYYELFQVRLKKKNWAYPGMAFRQVAENINLTFEENKETRFVFAGLNALSEAEMTIIKQLEQLGRAHVLINADAYYLKANYHEAGFFQRSLLQFLGKKELSFVENDMLQTKKKIDLIECSQHLAQVNVAANLLSELSPEQMNETLLLLADESLVAPMIKHLPLNVGRANITMGLELKNTSIRLWADSIFSIQENLVRFNTTALYHRDIFRLWQHPFVQAMMTDDLLAKQRELESQMIAKNKLFLSLERLSLGDSKLLEFYKSISLPWGNNWANGLKNIRQTHQIIYPHLSEKWTFEKALLKTFDKAVIAFQNAMEQEIPEMNLKTFRLLFQQHYGKQSIAYEGNPIDGLQIMGLLETRLLDFKNIICLGLNEGKMPPGNPIQTLIPMDLRANVGMPTTREKHGLFAHHFYRLLHKVETMTITYTSMQENMVSHEPSRYVQQLELEWMRQSKLVELTKKTYVLEAKTKSKTYDIIEKTPDVLEKIDKIFARSLSASALGKFLSCPMDFYYRYVLEYGEEEEIEEEMNNSTFGSIIHEVLENLYTEYAMFDTSGEKNPKGRSLVALDIAAMEVRYKEEIRKGFLNHYDGDESSFKTGKNYLSYQVALKLTKRFLQKDKAYIASMPKGLIIHSLEQPMKAEIELEIHGQKKTVNLSGFVDRIDMPGDKLRIVDYKSGKIKSEGVQMLSPKGKELSEVLYNTCIHKDKKYFLQLLIYGYLAKQKMGYHPNELEIISFINYPEGGLKMDTKGCNLSECIDELPNVLTRILEDIYDVNTPFKHKDELFSYCRYCD